MPRPTHEPHHDPDASGDDHSETNSGTSRMNRLAPSEDVGAVSIHRPITG
jgi:hypothetical protein